MGILSPKRAYGQTDPAIFADLDPDKIPRHIAVIMDGNGRWATKRHQPRAMGHRAGVIAVRNILRAAHDMGVDVLTVYAFSTENWKRPKDEVRTLMSLVVEFLRRETEEMHKFGVKIRVMGDYRALPDQVVQALEDSMRKTCDNTGIVFNLALNYGGEAEMVRAVQDIAREVAAGKLSPEDIDIKALRTRLYTAEYPDPELVIRTSGEMRLSNFMPLQTTYSELYFTPVLWPDFTPACLAEAVREYQRRHRRYGGL